MTRETPSTSWLAVRLVSTAPSFRQNATWVLGIEMELAEDEHSHVLERLEDRVGHGIVVAQSLTVDAHDFCPDASAQLLDPQGIHGFTSLYSSTTDHAEAVIVAPATGT